MVLVIVSASIASATYPNPDPRQRAHLHARQAPRTPLVVSPYEQPYQNHHMDLNPKPDRGSGHRSDTSHRKHKD
jgi:hypothetical protein